MRVAAVYTDARRGFSGRAPLEWVRCIVEYENREPGTSLDETSGYMTVPLGFLWKGSGFLEPIVNVRLRKVEPGARAKLKMPHWPFIGLVLVCNKLSGFFAR